MNKLWAYTGLALVGVLLGSCQTYTDEVKAPSEQQLQDARSKMKPASALADGIFHMQRVEEGSGVLLKQNIILKKPDLPPFDVAYVDRDLEQVVLELANAAGESVVLPADLHGQTVTVMHSGANFQQMLEIVLNKAGYSYNYVNGVWYITKYPVRNYVLEIGQSDRKGSLTSKNELTPEVAGGSTTGSGGDIDTEYSDTVWQQVKDTLTELVKIGAGGGQATPLNAVGVTTSGQLVAAGQNTAAGAVVGQTGLLAPPTTGNDAPDQRLFGAVQQLPGAPTSTPLTTTSMAGSTVANGMVDPSSTLPQTQSYGSTGDDGMPWVKVTESAGLITVRATPEAHRQIETYLAELEESAQRQVMVEARIVAIIRDKTTDHGSNFSKSVADATNSALSSIGFYANNPIAAATVSGGFFTLQNKSGDMSLVLQSLSTLGDVYTVSTPTLLARNNQIGRVSVTRQLGYAETQVDQNTTSTGDIIVGSRQDTAKFKNSGTVMSVLPFIGKTKVQMRFRMSVANKAGETTIKTSIGNATPIANTVPEMSSNVIDQDMVLEFGRIYAIGGLVESNTTIENSYEPTLRQIPGLGEIFQRAKNRGQDTEFLVLLKVTRS